MRVCLHTNFRKVTNIEFNENAFRSSRTDSRIQTGGRTVRLSYVHDSFAGLQTRLQGGQSTYLYI
jgi:hypothetical protein